jgi:hypothetical protein
MILVFRMDAALLIMAAYLSLYKKGRNHTECGAGKPRLIRTGLSRKLVRLEQVHLNIFGDLIFVFECHADAEQSDAFPITPFPCQGH